MTEIYKYEVLVNRVTKTGTIEAESFQDANTLVKKLYPEATYISTSMTRFFTGDIPRKTADTENDLCDFFDTYLSGVTEVKNSLETIGTFARIDSGYEKRIPFLFIEDIDGNIIEYFAFKADGTIIHRFY